MRGPRRPPTLGEVLDLAEERCLTVAQDGSWVPVPRSWLRPRERRELDRLETPAQSRRTR